MDWEVSRTFSKDHQSSNLQKVTVQELRIAAVSSAIKAAKKPPSGVGPSAATTTSSRKRKSKPALPSTTKEKKTNDFKTAKTIQDESQNVIEGFDVLAAFYETQQYENPYQSPSNINSFNR